ncbi:ABC transporter permease [Agrococcus sp. SGAir0287]|uniref:ABC transporter permease n=1 Tax=Agrococcus sp. SGAir0287 TaxID=2070347 RepID=UPI0010CCC41E|nr:ABC transporter permease [Agrococcus sp. SGAir0287]QCR18899.1 sugar ABC transporter [Agrococcus sp. SGAir0287]
MTRVTAPTHARDSWSPARRYRHSLWLLTSRDLRVRYSTSFLGYLWSVLDPLAMSAIYYFVFTVVFQRDVGYEPYIVFLLSGLLPWMWMSGAVSDSTRAFIKEARLIRSTKVPPTIWVARLTLAKGIEFVASLPVLALFAVIAGATLGWDLVHVGWEIVLFPLGIVLQAALVLGIGLIVAPLTVFFRDLERAVKLVLRFAFYATPIIYDLGDLPASLQTLGALNPLAGILSIYRSTFFPEALDWTAVGISAGITALVLLVGILVFRRSIGAVLKEV